MELYQEKPEVEIKGKKEEAPKNKLTEWFVSLETYKLTSPPLELISLTNNLISAFINPNHVTWESVEKHEIGMKN